MVTVSLGGVGTISHIVNSTGGAVQLRHQRRVPHQLPVNRTERIASGCTPPDPVPPARPCASSSCWRRCSASRYRPPPTPSTAATPFKVLALYSGTYDAAHIDFDKEANVWFPQQAAANGFTYTASTNWDLLANGGVNAYQVVLFLDDLPQTSAQRAGFEAYMRGGGAWMGFHVSAFTTDAASWSWYHNQFLGSGRLVEHLGADVGDPEGGGPGRTATKTCRPRSPRRSASGTAGPTICARTRTSRSWPRSTPAASRWELIQPVLVQRTCPNPCDQRAIQDAVRELRPQRDELHDQHASVVDVRARHRISSCWTA